MHRLTFLFALVFTCVAHAEEKLHRFLYAATPDGAQVESASGMGILVFDIDDGFKFVRRIEGPMLKGGTRGMTGTTEMTMTGMTGMTTTGVRERRLRLNA